MSLVRARGLGFTYPDGRAALRDVDLDVRAGEVVGLMGPNGSGKSTLLRLCATALRPGAGELSLLTKRPGRPLRATRRHIAAVFDHVPAADELDGRENLLRMLALRGVGDRVAAARADRWLDTFGLSARARDRVSTYSFGMRRKLGLAEAFAGDADLLLLDEATGGLDAAAREALAGALARGEAGDRETRGVLLSSHDHGYLARVSDRVVLLREGEVLADASPEALLEELDGGTLIEVETAAPPSPFDPPEGVRRLAGGGGTLRFVSDRGDDALPGLCRGLLRAGGSLRSLRIRDPDLEDVYLSLTGVSLREADIRPGDRVEVG